MKISMAVILVLGGLLWTGWGCEEHVVSESYSPMTGLSTGATYRATPMVSPVSTPPKRQQNMFEKAFDGMDQFLFGWAKDKKPTTQTPVPPGQSYDPIWVRSPGQ